MASSQINKMKELDIYLKEKGFVVTKEPIPSKFFGNYICEYTNYVFRSRILLIRDRGYVYVFLSEINSGKKWYSIINILTAIYKKKHRYFLKKQDKDSDGDYFYNLISSKDKIQTDLQVNLLKRYFTVIMSIFQENNLQVLSRIESENIYIETGQ